MTTKESLKNETSDRINKATKWVDLWKFQKAICLPQVCVKHSYVHTLQAGDGSDLMVAPLAANTIYVVHSWNAGKIIGFGLCFFCFLGFFCNFGKMLWTVQICSVAVLCGNKGEQTIERKKVSSFAVSSIRQQCAPQTPANR